MTEPIVFDGDRMGLCAGSTLSHTGEKFFAPQPYPGDDDNTMHVVWHNYKRVSD